MENSESQKTAPKSKNHYSHKPSAYPQRANNPKKVRCVIQRSNKHSIAKTKLKKHSVAKTKLKKH